MMREGESAETYIVNRYKVWEGWDGAFDYKHAKGERIARILLETGGLAPIALELGVGPGGVAAALSRHGMKIVGIDLSPEALVRAQAHCRGENVRLMRGSGFQLPLADKSLPLVYASQVLHLFDSSKRLRLMAEAHRVLLPGGRFVFDMKNLAPHVLRVFKYSAEGRRQNFPSSSHIAGLLREAGFSSVVKRPGLLPLMASSRVPNNILSRTVAHTTFFVATR